MYKNKNTKQTNYSNRYVQKQTQETNTLFKQKKKKKKETKEANKSKKQQKQEIQQQETHEKQKQKEAANKSRGCPLEVNQKAGRSKHKHDQEGANTSRKEQWGRSSVPDTGSTSSRRCLGQPASFGRRAIRQFLRRLGLRAATKTAFSSKKKHSF
jgi:hypothetical protein